MATDYTTNYHLDKYTATDKPNLRDQYNAAMDKIDTALLSANTNATEAKATTQSFAADIAAKADQTDLDALTQTVSGKASQTDLNALNALLPATQFSSQNTIKAALDAKANSSALSSLATKTEVQSEATTRANADTALGNRINSISGKSYMIAIGNSWVSNESASAYGHILERWMTNLYGETIRCYGKSGAGWLTPSPYNHLIEEAVTEAIETEQNPLDCKAIVLVEMQNDHSLFTNTASPNGYVAKIKQQIDRLRNVFKKAKIVYVADCHGTLVTPTEYYNYCVMLHSNFAFPVLYTPFMFTVGGYLNEGHLADNMQGYGTFAQHINRMVNGCKLHYPAVIQTVPDTADAKSTTLYSVGDPIDERNLSFSIITKIVKQTSIPTSIPLTVQHQTGVNWPVIAMLSGGLLAKANSKEGNINAPMCTFQVKTDGTVRVLTGPEVTAEISADTIFRATSMLANFTFGALS